MAVSWIFYARGSSLSRPIAHHLAGRAFPVHAVDLLDLRLPGRGAAIGAGRQVGIRGAVFDDEAVAEELRAIARVLPVPDQ